LARREASEVNPRHRSQSAAGTALDKAFQRKLIDRRLEEFVHGPRAKDVLAAFRKSAESGDALRMRQVVQMQGRLPRFVEGVVIRVAPDRLYGGLVIRELATNAESGFESNPLN
jgi:hypothetical protein